MKASIVIPAHNEEKFLAIALEAAEKLDYPDYEIIVVDNASADGTSRVAGSFGLVKVVQEQNKGTQHARERGRREAKGDFIANMDADCVPPADWLKKGVEIMRKHNAVAISGPVDYYDSSRIFRSVSFGVQKYLYSPINRILGAWGKGGIMLAGNCLIRSDALEAIGGYDTSFAFYGDDTDTAKRLSRIGKIVFDKNFTLKTSARRFKKIGIIKTFYLYVYHFLRVLFFGKKGIK